MAGAIRIGTSGWTYDSWGGPFYPDGLPKRAWLAYYASQFPTTEINSAFYRTPSLDAIRLWRAQTPNDFLFSWKASKFITHWKRLTDKSENSIALMQTRLKLLGPQVGVVLFQLPARFARNDERMRSFVSMLPRRRLYAFEFRNKEWYAGEIFELLRCHGIALCFSDHADAPAPWEVTAPHIYIRGHGPSGRYSGCYSGATLRRWAQAARTWRAQGRDVFVYFDNDQKAAAPADARRFMHLLEC